MQFSKISQKWKFTSCLPVHVHGKVFWSEKSYGAAPTVRRLARCCLSISAISLCDSVKRSSYDSVRCDSGKYTIIMLCCRSIFSCIPPCGLVWFFWNQNSYRAFRCCGESHRRALRCGFSQAFFLRGAGPIPLRKNEWNRVFPTIHRRNTPYKTAVSYGFLV